MNNFRLITITHKTANIDHIGKYIPSVNAHPDQLVDTLHRIKEKFEIGELLYLATCNRLTFLFVKDQPLTDKFVIDVFRELHPDIPEHCLGGLMNVMATYEGEECVRHMFQVASSLDSLVVGEHEILRQLKDAYSFCKENKLSGDSIRLLMKMAVPIAKEVYTKTKIGENSVSIVSLAMKGLKSIPKRDEAKVLIIGAGQTNTLAAKFLKKFGYQNIVVFNRSIERAQSLADNFNGKAFELSELKNYSEGFDVLITCTSASEYIVNTELYQKLTSEDPTKKRTLIDLAVPNDIHPKVVSDFPVNYIKVEKLRDLAAENLALRIKEVEHANNIIEERVAEFTITCRRRRVERAMSVIPDKVRAVKEKAISRVFHKEISSLDESSQEVLQKVIDYMEKKYIGIPMSVARDVITNELDS